MWLCLGMRRWPEGNRRPLLSCCCQGGYRLRTGTACRNACAGLPLPICVFVDMTGGCESLAHSGALLDVCLAISTHRQLLLVREACRKAFAQVYAAEAGRVAETMARLRAEELTARDEFRSAVERYIPGNVLGCRPYFLLPCAHLYVHAIFRLVQLITWLEKLGIRWYLESNQSFCISAIHTFRTEGGFRNDYFCSCLLFRALGLLARPPHCEVNVPPPDTGLADVALANLEDIPSALQVGRNTLHAVRRLH